MALDEEEMVLAKADQAVAGGLPGKTSTKLGAECRKLCRKIAEGEPSLSVCMSHCV